MRDDLKKIEKTAEKQVNEAATEEELEKIRLEYLGRREGALTLILRSLGTRSAEEKKEIGGKANALRQKLEKIIHEKQKEIAENTQESVLRKEWLDTSRPGQKAVRGHLHPITLVTREAVSIFSSMGFEIAEGPEMETEHYNFDALNIPANHPARDMWDTFWLRSSESKTQRLLLRTHTSPVQIRYMEKHSPPLRIIVPGRAYRYEATDASHDFQFNQIEGLLVDEKVSVANFKSVMKDFFSRFFKKDISLRLRPSFFPFVEPGFEVDISCVNCGRVGCSVCKKTGWLELAGAGMVHPHVFKSAGYAAGEHTGFAFGMGLDRLTMMKYKIDDIRLFNSGDLRFLNQF